MYWAEIKSTGASEDHRSLSVIRRTAPAHSRSDCPVHRGRSLWSRPDPDALVVRKEGCGELNLRLRLRGFQPLLRMRDENLAKTKEQNWRDNRRPGDVKRKTC